MSKDHSPAATPKSADEVSETDLILNLANPDAAASAPAKHIDPRWQKQYEGLQELHDYLQDQISAHSSEARGDQAETVQSEPGEVNTSDLLRDYLLAMTSTEQDTLNEVDEALRRVESGTYGTCEFTGKPIPEERLAVMPWTRFSVEAQDLMEKHNESPVHAAMAPAPRQPTPPQRPVPGSDAEREVSEPPPEGTEKMTSRDHR